MTNPEILKLAKTCEFHYHKIWRHKGGKSDNQIHWECWEDQLLKFALLIYEDGYNKGYKEGYGEGRYDGYESAKVSTEMNTMEFDDETK